MSGVSPFRHPLKLSFYFSPSSVRMVLCDNITLPPYNEDEYKRNFDHFWTRVCDRADGRGVAADYRGHQGDLNNSDHYGPRNTRCNYPDRADAAFFQANTDEYYSWSSLSERFHDRQCRLLYRPVSPERPLMTFRAMPYGNGDEDRVLVQMGVAVTDFTHIKHDYSYDEEDLPAEARGDPKYRRFLKDFLWCGGFNCFLQRRHRSEWDREYYCQLGEGTPFLCCYADGRGGFTDGVGDGDGDGDGEAETCRKAGTGPESRDLTCLNATGPDSESVKEGCVAYCHSSLIMQVELYPKTNVDTRVNITALAFLQRLAQPPKMNVEMTDFSKYNSFGFNYEKDMRARYYSKEMPLGEEESRLEAGEMRGFWIKWIERDQSSGSGPFIQVGNEGQVTPFVNYDVSQGLGEDSVLSGWVRGWEGNEVLQPRLHKIFQPRYYSVQGVKNNRPLRIWLPCQEDEYLWSENCVPQVLYAPPGEGVKPEEVTHVLPVLVGVAGGLVGVALLVCCVGAAIYRFGGGRRNVTVRSDTMTRKLAQLKIDDVY